MDDKRQSHVWPPTQSPVTASNTSIPAHQLQHSRSDSNYQSPLPPILPTKRPYDDSLWVPAQHPNPHPHAHPHAHPHQPHTQQHHQTQSPLSQTQQPQQQQQQQQHVQPHPSQVHARLGPMRSLPHSSPIHQRNPQDLYTIQHRPDDPAARRMSAYVPAPESPNRFKDVFDDAKLTYSNHRRNSAPNAQQTAMAAAAAAAAAAQAHMQHVAPQPQNQHQIHSSTHSLSHTQSSAMSTPPTTSNSSPMDAFILAAEMGARAQSAVDSASGEGVFETYELGKTIVASSKLYANQRRSNRLLPGGSDSTTAACYMIGGTPDSILSPLVSRVNPCDPREERCKAVERVLKDKTRGAICALNGENPREARADNLAAVRICEVVADILVAYSSRRLMETRKELYATVTKQEGIIKELREELAKEKRKRVELETECWCKGQGDANRHVLSQDVNQFDTREKLMRRGVLPTSVHRSLDSDRGSLSEVAPDKSDEIYRCYPRRRNLEKRRETDLTLKMTNDSSSKVSETKASMTKDISSKGSETKASGNSTGIRCGMNSYGNRYNTPGGSNKSSSSSYHYSNKDGSYYYKNDDGSTYFNPGDGTGGYLKTASGESRWCPEKK